MSIARRQRRHQKRVEEQLRGQWKGSKTCLMTPFQAKELMCQGRAFDMMVQPFNTPHGIKFMLSMALPGYEGKMGPMDSQSSKLKRYCVHHQDGSCQLKGDLQVQRCTGNREQDLEEVSDLPAMWIGDVGLAVVETFRQIVGLTPKKK